MKFLKVSRIVFAILFFSCNVDAHSHCHEHEHDHEHADVEGEEEGFLWTKEKSDLANIQVQIAGPGLIQNRIQVAGKVISHPDHLAYVHPKVPGTVLEIRKNLGDSVAKEEILALIESREIAEAKANHLACQKKRVLLQSLMEKEKNLKGISAEQDYLHAKLEYEQAVINCDFATQRLYTLGLTDQEISNIAQESPTKWRFYEMKSPLAGKILQRNLTAGELVNDLTKAFTVGNFEKVLVEIHVAQNDAHYLKDGLPLEIVSSAGRHENLSICQFNPSICEETRMATATALLENSSGEWTPGEFLSAYVQTDVVNVPLVVSKEAIQNIKGETYIFIEEGGNFIPSLVKLGKMDEENVEIISGLKAGDTYASCNTFCMKAEHEKENVEHSH